MDALLATHIAGGVTALATGPVAMSSRKGGPVHMTWGRIYGVAMLIVALSSLVLGVLHHRDFLLLVGLFTLQLLVSGYRALRIRRAGVAPFDWGFQAVALLMSLVFVGWGVRTILGGDFAGTVAIVFGGISLALAARWLRLLKGASTEKALWLRHHLIGMGAAYIATTTAALVVNFQLPYGLGWLLPTIIGTPLIGRSVRGVRRTTTTT